MRKLKDIAFYIAAFTVAGLPAAFAGTPIPVPEPASLAILGAGAAGVLAVRRLRGK